MAVNVVTNIHHDQETGLFAYSNTVVHSDATSFEEKAGVLYVHRSAVSGKPCDCGSGKPCTCKLPQSEVIAVYARDAWRSASVVAAQENPRGLLVKFEDGMTYLYTEETSEDGYNTTQMWKPVRQSPQGDVVAACPTCGKSVDRYRGHSILGNTHASADWSDLCKDPCHSPSVDDEVAESKRAKLRIQQQADLLPAPSDD